MTGTEIARADMLPEPEQFVELRAALADHDDWPTLRSRARVIAAAKNVLVAWEAQKLQMHALMAKFGGGNFRAGSGAGTMIYRTNAQAAEGDTP